MAMLSRTRTSTVLAMVFFSRFCGSLTRLAFVTAAQGGEIEFSILLSSNFRSSVMASCDGLILETDRHDLRIVNPVTKGCFDLPWLPGFEVIREFGIAYAAASVEYKVVATYSFHSSYESRQCSILTVGVDNAWRHVATRQLSPEAKSLLHGYMHMTEGFMHWACSSGYAVLTMNVETEAFAVSRAPLEFRIRRHRHHYLSAGRYLTLLVPCGDFSWEVWEMEGGSGEWRKVLASIDLSARKSEFQQLAASNEEYDYPVPVGWVKYPKVLLFLFRNVSARSCMIYDIDKDETESIELPAPIHGLEAMVHKTSLVCLR